MSAARDALERIMDELRMEDTSRFDDDISKLGALVRRCELEDELLDKTGIALLQCLSNIERGDRYAVACGENRESFGPTLLAALEQAAKGEER